MGNEGRLVFTAGGAGRGDGLCYLRSGARRDWCVTERSCQWETVVSGGARASLMRNGIWVFHPWRCGQGEFDFGLREG